MLLFLNRVKGSREETLHQTRIQVHLHKRVSSRTWKLQIHWRGVNKLWYSSILLYFYYFDWRDGCEHLWKCRLDICIDKLVCLFVLQETVPCRPIPVTMLLCPGLEIPLLVVLAEPTAGRLETGPRQWPWAVLPGLLSPLWPSAMAGTLEELQKDEEEPQKYLLCTRLSTPLFPSDDSPTPIIFFLLSGSSHVKASQSTLRYCHFERLVHLVLSCLVPDSFH